MFQKELAKKKTGNEYFNFNTLICSDRYNGDPFYHLNHSARSIYYQGECNLNLASEFLADFIYFTETYKATRKLLGLGVLSRTEATLIHNALDDPKDHEFSPHHHRMVHRVPHGLMFDEFPKLMARIWNMHCCGFDTGEYTRFLVNEDGVSYCYGLKFEAENLPIHEPGRVSTDIFTLFKELYGDKYLISYRKMNQCSHGYLGRCSIKGDLIHIHASGRARSMTYDTAKRTLNIEFVGYSVSIKEPAKAIYRSEELKSYVKEAWGYDYRSH